MTEKKLDLSLLLEFYGGLLTDRQREMTDYCYNDDLSLSEIAELTGITRQGVWEGLRKSESILRSAEEKLKLYESYKKRLETVDYVIGRLKEMAGEGAEVKDLLDALENMPLG